MSPTTLEDRPVDVLVIGAGPAGAATAAFCQRAGLSVRVLEQASFPRFAIGESLLPHAMDVLQEAGLLEPLREAGYLEKPGVRFLRGAERCDFVFPRSPRGWGWAWQVRRDDFDHRLARAVEAMGVPIHFRHAVQQVRFDAAGVTVEVLDAAGSRAETRGRFLVDASGNGRVLPRLLGLDAPSTLPPRGALFAHVTGDRRPTGSEAGWIWICVHPQGAWTWIIPFADGTTSVGVVGDPEFFARFPGTPSEALLAILRADPAASGRLSEAQPVAPAKKIDGFSASVTRLWGPGYCLVGNATGFLDPIFASGVTLALESARRASALIVRALKGEAVGWESEYTAPLARGTNVFRTFVARWYDGTLPGKLFGVPGASLDRNLNAALAGDVWNEANPFVHDPDGAIRALG